MRAEKLITEPFGTSLVIWFHNYAAVNSKQRTVLLCVELTATHFWRGASIFIHSPGSFSPVAR